jgi:outer membrane protein assembly factor BamD (BamD/ComL family)
VPRAAAPGAGISSSPRATERSQLAEQNDLYARAVTSREAGDTAGALALFERLVARYPSSPLAENASAERMKLFASTHRPEASQAASDYLARYPAGFARRDAEEIVARERRLH